MNSRTLDVRVRLPRATLPGLQPHHLYSELDQEPDGVAPPGQVRGKTEWAVHGSPALSFGWDFTYEDATGSLFGHWDALRSNVVVLGDDGRELARAGACDCVAQWITDAGWERTVAAALGLALGTRRGH